MMTHEQKTRLGIFLSIALILLLVGLGFFLVPKLRETGDTYFIDFRKTSVNGLLRDSSVRYQGVDIGKVTRIEVNRQDLDSVFVYIKVQKGFPIKKDTKAVLMLAGITGIRFIDLRGGTRDSVRLPPGEEIQMGQRMGTLEEQAGDISVTVETAVKSFNDLLSPGNREKITRFLERAAKSSEMIASVLEAKRTKLENSFDSVEKVTAELATVTENLRKITVTFSDVSEKIVAHSESAVRNIDKRFSDEEMGQVIKDFRTFIDSTSSSLKRIETSILAQEDGLKQAIANLSATMDNLSRFTREISEDPTALIRPRKEKKK
jgi:phospholipid/cholesterol/gamma-HCH transport system substrate-binding protein